MSVLVLAAGRNPIAASHYGFGTNSNNRMGRYLITGGAGFIGSNLAARLLTAGHGVTIFDNLSRDGVGQNLHRLQAEWQYQLRFIRGDIRDRADIRQALVAPDIVFHCAGQVGFVSSMDDPGHDFDVNAAGTVNLLEEIRRSGRKCPVFFPSTNKIYGALGDVPVREDASRYRYADLDGINEETPLTPDNPYACSKAAAESYLRLYQSLYDIPFVIFRMSCIWGTGQYGTEDQGWLAHFLGSLVSGKAVNIYGDGKQVRDVLHVSDLVTALDRLIHAFPAVANRTFNIGGGPENTLSILEYLELCEALTGKTFKKSFGPWRHSDQKVYISDARQFQSATGWKPTSSVKGRLSELLRWIEKTGLQ